MPGKTSDALHYGDLAHVLQWGPGRMPGKTHSRVEHCCSCRRASMGPRQDAGEDSSFNLPNDNTSMLQWGPGRMPGKTWSPETLRGTDEQLQWGPGRMPGKTAFTEWANAVYGKGFNGAPAGCRGRQELNRRGRLLRKCFNGAPAGCRGRLRPLRAATKDICKASMGPRQDAGEDSITHNVPAGYPACFNGAPAGCRGRQRK